MSDFKSMFLTMNPNILCLLIFFLMIVTNLFMYTMDKFSESMTDERLLKLEERLDSLTAPLDKQESLPLIAPKTIIPPENTDTILKWYGLSQSEINDIKKVDDSKMLDGVPVLGKGVYNRKHDPVAQLKGVDCASFYD